VEQQVGEEPFICLKDQAVPGFNVDTADMLRTKP
jgi:hypothetical protein